MSKAKKPEVASYFHNDTNSVSHLVFDRSSRAAAIIDPVLDFDASSAKTATHSVDRMVTLAKAEGLNVKWILETHIHADHLTAAPYIKMKLGGQIAAGAGVVEMQQHWNDVFNFKGEARAEPDVFDRLFEDGETFAIGALEARVMATPGHTSADITYVIGDAAFIGDTLFMPDYGTARADFPGGDARMLHRSIDALMSLPEDTRLFLCHDYLTKSRTQHRWESTVRDQRRNVLLAGKSADEFVLLREARDKTLGAPALFYPSLQINLRAGLAPPPEDNGASYLKTPLS